MAVIAPITAIPVAITHFQSVGFFNLGFSAIKHLPSEVNRTASTPPPSTYAAFTSPFLSKERTHPLKIEIRKVSGQSLPLAIRRSTFFFISEGGTDLPMVVFQRDFLFGVFGFDEVVGLSYHLKNLGIVDVTIEI